MPQLGPVKLPRTDPAARMRRAAKGYRPGMSELEGSPFYEEAKSKRRTPAPAHADVEGVPAEEDVDAADVEERLEEEPEEAANRRDVPPTPENTIEARTEDD